MDIYNNNNIMLRDIDTWLNGLSGKDPVEKLKEL